MELREGMASHKYRKRHFSELTADEVVDIAHAFFVEERPRRDIAEQFRISVDLVSRISRQYRANESFIADLREKEGRRDVHVDAVMQSVTNLMKQHGRISSISPVILPARGRQLVRLSSRSQPRPSGCRSTSAPRGRGGLRCEPGAPPS